MTGAGLRRRQGGFTLLEATAVVILVLVVAALARPVLSGFLESIKHKGAVTAVKRTLQSARAKALANPMVHCGIYFDAESVPPRLVPFLDTHSPGTNSYDPERDRAYLSPYVFPEGVVLELAADGPPALVFRGDGSAHFSGRMVVKSSRLADTVDVLASTGRIKAWR